MNVLNGIRRSLRPMAHEWEMVFVGSGAEALKALESQFFDIIVSDLRMPHMDGVTLLQEVRRRSPETVRIALSGYANRDITMRAASQIHQFLMKPCDSAELTNVLRRATNLGALLTNERLRSVLSHMETLPSISTVLERVIRELELPEPSAANLGALIARDAAMSTKVLQLTNSAIFGLPNVVSDPVYATVLLGLEALHLLVLSIRIFDQFTFEDVGGISVSRLWNHCVSVARLAKRISMAEEASQALAERAFLAGLLHDIGKLMLASDNPERYQSVVNLGGSDINKICGIETRVLGANHAEVGAYLMGLWGFSESVIEAIHLHHKPSASPSNDFSPLTAVHVANAYLHTIGVDKPSIETFVDMEHLEQIGLTHRLPVWQEVVMDSLGKGFL
jgi:putative nucleotidyltransferase with HDIG domain